MKQEVLNIMSVCLYSCCSYPAGKLIFYMPHYCVTHKQYIEQHN